MALSNPNDAGAASTCSVTEITTDDEFSSHVTSIPKSALLVIYFHAPWAAPCKQMSTILSTLASTYPLSNPPAISFLSINAEELPDISEQYDVTAVPYIVLQKDNQTLDTVSGSDAAKVRAAVERHAGKSGGGGSGGGENGGLPPAQSVTKPEQQAPGANGSATVTKDLASYAPTDSVMTDAPAEEEAPSKEELFKRLEGLVKAAPVMLFMKGTPSAPQCGFSRQTVGLLRENGIRYGFFNILADNDVRQGLKEYADWPTFPQLWVNGDLVGGLDIVREEFTNDPDFLKEYSVNAQKTEAASS